MIQLSILIPTYNRAPYLLKNLEMLAVYIRRAGLEDDIELIVSNNLSSDRTDIEVKQFASRNEDIVVKYYIQRHNIGLEKNALFVLKKANGTYVMFLGDDDYIEYNYLVESLNHLKVRNSIACVIPSNYAIDLEGNNLGFGRDTKLKDLLTPRGFKNCLKNSWRGHQLSGLVFRREGLLEKYINLGVSNIYPFIFFVAQSCLEGDTLHLTGHPVKVTSPGQQNKDWGYGYDGLLNEVFDNYRCLKINSIKKSILELYFYKRATWRLWAYQSKGIGSFIKAFLNIWFSKNSSLGFKSIFPFFVFLQALKRSITQ